MKNSLLLLAIALGQPLFAAEDFTSLIGRYTLTQALEGVCEPQLAVAVNSACPAEGLTVGAENGARRLQFCRINEITEPVAYHGGRTSASFSANAEFNVMTGLTWKLAIVQQDAEAGGLPTPMAQKFQSLQLKSLGETLSYISSKIEVIGMGRSSDSVRCIYRRI
jgi:hypothetical protein